jgi:O-methyltransferase involved in polyketide biosynthesis
VEKRLKGAAAMDNQKSDVFSIPVNHVSDTAYLVAAFRLAESKRPDRYFDDSLAEKLLGKKGRDLVKQFPDWKLERRSIEMIQ